MRYSLEDIIEDMFKDKYLCLLLEILEINMVKKYLIKVLTLVNL